MTDSEEQSPPKESWLPGRLPAGRATLGEASSGDESPGRMRPTHAEVDLDAIARNLERIAKRTTARVFAVVKADAYGHGVIPVARRLVEAGVGGFCVALAEEGVELRQAGIDAEIVVMNGVYGDGHEEVLRHGLSPVVYTLEDVAAFSDAYKRLGFPPSEGHGLHLKIDSGMGRLGVTLPELPEFLRGLEAFPKLRLDGLMTHFASAEDDDASIDAQLRAFATATAMVRDRGFQPRLVHAANTAATLRAPAAHFDAVRVGLGLFGYGVGPDDITSRLEPAMKVRSRIIALRTVEPGGRVGYGGEFTAMRRSTIATLPLGYADGLHWRLGNCGRVVVQGQVCPIVGRISMDLTGVDVTDLPQVQVGDAVKILGPDDAIRADRLAEAAGTIPYEVLTSISKRVPRFYLP